MEAHSPPACSAVSASGGNPDGPAHCTLWNENVPFPPLLFGCWQPSGLRHAGSGPLCWVFVCLQPAEAGTASMG